MPGSAPSHSIFRLATLPRLDSVPPTLPGYRQVTKARMYLYVLHTHTGVLCTHRHTHTAPTRDCGVQSHMCTHSQASGSQNTDAICCKIWLTGVCSKPTKCRAKVGNTVPLWMGAWNEWSAYGHPEAEGHRPPLPKGAKESGVAWMGTVL